ncbi:hypothetical protein G6F43_001595 [Rhizopus delemar]|nr:hypothetical protein G6F43_001595 [Rhizopus delemar]
MCIQKKSYHGKNNVDPLRLCIKRFDEFFLAKRGTVTFWDDATKIMEAIESNDDQIDELEIIRLIEQNKKTPKNTMYKEKKEISKTSVERLLYEDVFTEEMVKNWQHSRIKAWKERHRNLEQFYFRLLIPGNLQRVGLWTDEEHSLFMKRYDEWIAGGLNIGTLWGLFSKTIPHRVGYQCMTHYRSLLFEGKLKDDNFEVIEGKLICKVKGRQYKKRPLSDYGNEMDSEEAKKLSQKIDEWVERHHPNFVHSRSKAKTKRTPSKRSSKRIPSRSQKSIPHKRNADNDREFEL